MNYYVAGCLGLTEVSNGNLGNAPVFRNGLGKSVEVKQSSLSRALEILGNGGDEVIRTGSSFKFHYIACNVLTLLSCQRLALYKLCYIKLLMHELNKT